MFSLDQQIQLLTSLWVETSWGCFWQSGVGGHGNERLNKVYGFSTFWEMTLAKLKLEINTYLSTVWKTSLEQIKNLLEHFELFKT